MFIGSSCSFEKDLENLANYLGWKVFKFAVLTFLSWTVLFVVQINLNMLEIINNFRVELSLGLDHAAFRVDVPSFTFRW